GDAARLNGRRRLPDRYRRGDPERREDRKRLGSRGRRRGSRRYRRPAGQHGNGSSRAGEAATDRRGAGALPAERQALCGSRKNIQGRAVLIKAVKGTRDILPPASAVWNHVESAAREVFRAYNYHEIRTPILEETALFARSVGEDTDIVSKEMYTFEDRDGSSLTLRPEATASVIRAYIEHRLDQVPGLKKLYYMGPMFRRERPQKGRYRQFYQIGAEAIGSESPAADAEVIEMVVEVL